MAQDQEQTENENVRAHQPAFWPRSASPEALINTQWVTFGHRVTFTFVMGDDVGSVHFDKSRQEIFIKGHNIRNMDLDQHHLKLLEKMRDVLKSHPKLRNFINPYSRLLDKIVQEHTRQGASKK